MACVQVAKRVSNGGSIDDAILARRSEFSFPLLLSFFIY
jgi:hypothetical protein